MKKLFLFFLMAMNIPQCVAQKLTFDGITMMQPFENFVDSLKAKGYDIWLDETCFLGSGNFLGRNTQVFLVTIKQKSDVYYADEIVVGYSFKTRQEANAFMQSAIKRLERIYPHFKASTESGWRILEGEKGTISICMGEKENMSNSNMIYPDNHKFVVSIDFETDSSDELLTVCEVKSDRDNKDEANSDMCGDHLIWTYDKSTKTLTISGSGEMYDYDEASQTPWNEISSEIQTLVISSGVKTIGQNAFKHFMSLSDVRIGNSVTSIGSSAFEGCHDLKTIALPNNVKSLGEAAFKYCFGLTSVTIGNGMKSIGSDVFFGCTSLTNIVVNKGNTVYDSRNNCNAIVESKSNTLIVGCKNTVIPNSIVRIGEVAFNSSVGLKKVIIPNSVNHICNCAFWNCNGLESVTVPSSVTTISYRTFALCTDLKTIAIPNSVFRIDKEAFYFCKSLELMNIPNSVTRIGPGAFSECESLSSVIIPSSVLIIRPNAFSGCSSLKDIHCRGREPIYVYSSIFDASTYSSATLFIPKGTKEAYQTDETWGLFEKIVEE